MPTNMIDNNLEEAAIADVIAKAKSYAKELDYTTVMQRPFDHPRGFTPFQFSSRKNQVNTTQLGGLIPDNPISSLLSEATSCE